MQLLCILLAITLPWSTHVHGQNTPTAPVPLEPCGITTSYCAGGVGCCTVGNCCGGGCCLATDICINQGTANEACCSLLGDSTECGTLPASSSGGSGSGGSGSGGSGTHNCVGVQACPALTEGGVGWSCVLGKTCGLTQGECYPCPYLVGGGGSASTTSSSDSSAATPSPPSSSSGGSSDGSGGSTGSSGSGSSGSGSSGSGSSGSGSSGSGSSGSGSSGSSSSATTPSASSTTTRSAGYSIRHDVLAGRAVEVLCLVAFLWV